MGRVQRQLLPVTLVTTLALVLCVLNLASGGFSAHAQPSVPCIAGTDTGCPTSGNWYGSSLDWMITATNDWFQKKDFWCGVAVIQAMERYDWLKYDGNASPTYESQYSLGYNTANHDPYNGLLNTSAAISPWGQADPGLNGPGPKFVADIAADGGLDPRGLAWGIWDVTPNGYYFHNWIYETGNTTAGAKSATNDFAADYGPHNGLNDPIAVAINTGMHFFVIDGVWASSDPSAGGDTLYDIDTWDPWLNQAGASFDGTYPYNTSINEVWSLSDWLGQTNQGPTWMWQNPYNTANKYDPDPSTGLFGHPGSPYYDQPLPAPNNQTGHWNTYWVTIEQDEVTSCQASPNIAYDQNGNPSPHNGVVYCP
ncbi:MAG: hypothetical protein OJF49_004125 [Ktedonobacterales bacterium]|jgi:hypothetical protein|nr:MAG: hypothetical protein OJF49_004125 [Ktedonobacterales bacterium]